jgi:plasmid recombination enzyme
MIHGLINIKGYANDGTRMKQLEEHIKRTKDTYKNKNIDKTKTKENVVLMESSDTYSQRVNKIIDDNDLKLQKHTNVVMAAVIKLNEKDSDTLKQNFTREDYINFFTSQQDKFLKEYGIKKDAVLDSVIHFDETEPHLHLTFIPVATVKDTEKDDKERELYLRKECAKKARAELKKEVSEDEFKKLPKTSVLLDKYHNKGGITNNDDAIIFKMYDLYDKWRDIAYENGWGLTKKNAGKVTISKNELGLGGKDDFHKLQENAYKWTRDSLNDIGKDFLCKSVVRKFYEDKKYIKDIEKFKEMNQETFIKTKEDKRLDNELPLNIDKIPTDYELDKTLAFTGAAYKKESVDNAINSMKKDINDLKQSVKETADRNKKLVNDNIELECSLNIALKKNNEDDIKIEELKNENKELSKTIATGLSIGASRKDLFKKLEDSNDIRKHYLEKEKKADYDMEDAKNVIDTFSELTRNQDKIIEQKSQELYKDKVKKLEEFLENKDFIGALNTFDKSSVKTEIIDKINDNIEKKTKTINDMDNKIVTLQNKCENVEKQLNEYEKKYKEEIETVKFYNENPYIITKTAKIKQKQRELKNITDEIEEKSGLLDKKNNDLQEIDKKLSQKNSELQKLKELDKKIQDFEDKIKKLQEDYNKKVQDFDDEYNYHQNDYNYKTVIAEHFIDNVSTVISKESKLSRDEVKKLIEENINSDFVYSVYEEFGDSKKYNKPVDYKKLLKELKYEETESKNIIKDNYRSYSYDNGYDM